MTCWDQFGEAYDHPYFGGLPRVYLVASTPRSGSHYLGHLLFETGDLGSPLEYFHPGHKRTWQKLLGADSFEDTIRRLFRRRSSPTGWFGVKAHWTQFISVLEDPEIFKLLDISQYVYISRQDVVAQAVSLVIARQTKAWISFHEPQAKPEYNFDEIIEAIKEIRQQRRCWEGFFASNGIDPIVIDYEAIVSDPYAVISDICSKFGLDSNHRAKRLDCLPMKQSSELNATWHSKFLADLEKKE